MHIAPSREIAAKEVNSPLITFTLYNPKSGIDEPSLLPSGTYAQLIFEHYIGAKYPPVRTLYRDLDEGEEPSSVMGSSLCSYLLRNHQTNTNSTNDPVWTWDDQGCRVSSSNRTHSVCICNHLTGFANLMDFHNYLVISN